MAKSRIRLTRNVAGLGFVGDLLDDIPESTIKDLLAGDACVVVEHEPATSKAAAAPVETAMMPKAKAKGE